MIKKTRLIAAIITGLAVGTIASYLLLSSEQDHQPLPEYATILRNFDPGTEIVYTVISNQNKTVSGAATVDNQGTLKISKEKLKQLDGGPLAYDFKISRKDSSDSFNIGLSFDHTRNAVSAKALGLEKFSEVTLNYKNLNVKTRADWAGKFENTSLFDEEISSKDSGTLKLAFHGPGAAFMTDRESPFIIEVLYAPGGGRPPDHSWTGSLFPNAENNIYEFGFPSTDLRRPPPEGHYEETACSSPNLNPPPTECWVPDMAEQIVNVVENYVESLIRMTEQMTAVMMQHTAAVGMFMDAKMQMQTQREIQKLVTEAHKDYHPSDQMCRFGTFVRSVADAEQRMNFNKQAFNTVMMSAYTGVENSVTAEGYSVDMASRVSHFRNHYCDPHDNNSGLEVMCGSGAITDRRKNKDINYTQSFDFPMTLDIDFSDSVSSEDEEDVMALARHLYWPKPFEGAGLKGVPSFYTEYMEARNLLAMNNIAHNSFAHIMAMKSHADPAATGTAGWEFMKFLLDDMGINNTEFNKMLGDRPSYFAQMEILTRKIYQDAKFYTNLYDKPANVKRIGVSMDAIKMMQLRDRYESALRREMLSSLLVEQALRKHVNDVNTKLITKSVQ